MQISNERSAEIEKRRRLKERERERERERQTEKKIPENKLSLSFDQRFLPLFNLHPLETIFLEIVMEKCDSPNR